MNITGILIGCLSDESLNNLLEGINCAKSDDEFKKKLRIFAIAGDIDSMDKEIEKRKPHILNTYYKNMGYNFNKETREEILNHPRVLEKIENDLKMKEKSELINKIIDLRTDKEIVTTKFKY